MEHIHNSPSQDIPHAFIPKPAALAQPESRQSNDRDAWVELAVGYGLILLVIWTHNPWQRVFYWTAIAWIVLVSVLSFDGWRPMGLTFSGLRRSLWVVGVALGLATAGVVLAGRMHTLHNMRGPAAFLRSFWGYGIWAFLQQFLLQDFMLLRLLRVLPSRRAAVMAAAGLFALAHLPSPILAPITLLWGLAACTLFLRYRNVYSLGMAHAIFGICIAVTIPGRVDHNMRVGLGYLTYRPHLHHHRNHSDHIVSTQACVIALAPTRRS